MSKTPFMPLWVSDFLGDTLDLDAAEIGAYMLLLMAQWNRDGNSLPDDDAKLRRVARCGRSWPRIWANISRYFHTDENGVYSKRLRFEAASVAAKRAVNAHNGALGGSAKALKSQETELANATNSLERKSSIPEPEPYNKDTSASLFGENDDPEHSERIEKPPAKKPRRACQIPPDWVPSDKNIQDAQSKDFSEKEIDHEADQFRDYHLAKGTTLKDWDAGWRTWLGNARKFAGNRGMAGQSKTGGYGQGRSIASIVAQRRLDG